MRKLFFTVVTVFIAGCCFASNNSNFSNSNSDKASTVSVVVSENEDVESTPNISNAPLPGPRYIFHFEIQFGRGMDCIGRWPICSISFFENVEYPKDGTIIDAFLEVYDKEALMCFDEKSIMSTTNADLKKNLLNVKNVKFGQDSPFPEEVIKKCGLAPKAGIDMSTTYAVSKDKGRILVHIPL